MKFLFPGVLGFLMACAPTPVVVYHPRSGALMSEKKCLPLVARATYRVRLEDGSVVEGSLVRMGYQVLELAGPGGNVPVEKGRIRCIALLSADALTFCRGPSNLEFLAGGLGMTGFVGLAVGTISSLLFLTPGGSLVYTALRYGSSRAEPGRWVPVVRPGQDPEAIHRFCRRQR